MVGRISRLGIGVSVGPLGLRSCGQEPSPLRLIVNDDAVFLAPLQKFCPSSSRPMTWVAGRFVRTIAGQWRAFSLSAPRLPV